ARDVVPVPQVEHVLHDGDVARALVAELGRVGADQRLELDVEHVELVLIDLADGVGVLVAAQRAVHRRAQAAVAVRRVLALGRVLRGRRALLARPHRDVVVPLAVAGADPLPAGVERRVLGAAAGRPLPLADVAGRAGRRARRGADAGPGAAPG